MTMFMYLLDVLKSVLFSFSCIFFHYDYFPKSKLILWIPAGGAAWMSAQYTAENTLTQNARGKLHGYFTRLMKADILQRQWYCYIQAFTEITRKCMRLTYFGQTDGRTDRLRESISMIIPVSIKKNYTTWLARILQSIYLNIYSSFKIKYILCQLEMDSPNIDSMSITRFGPILGQHRPKPNIGPILSPWAMISNWYL